MATVMEYKADFVSLQIHHITRDNWSMSLAMEKNKSRAHRSIAIIFWEMILSPVELNKLLF